MAFANNGGVRIHYEGEGEGPPLALVHGLSASSEFWRITGYVGALKNEYRLILIDPRGHGSSDKPHDPEDYGMALRAADVVAVLDDLQASRASFLGYSMGGWTGWSIAKYAPERFYSLIIGGCSPYGIVPDEFSFLDLYQQGMEASLAAGEELFGPRWTPDVRAMFAANDLQALTAVLLGMEDLGFEDLLPAVAVPCLLFGGEADSLFAGADECAKRMPDATVVTLPGVDHIEAQFRPDLMLPHIRKFWAEVGEI